MSSHSMNDLLDPCVETTLRGHRQAINWISFSNYGNRLVSGSDDNNVMLWSLEEEKQSICYRLVGHTNAVLSVAFTDDYLLSSSKDCSVRLWRLNRLNERSPENESVVYRCHSSSIRCVDANVDSTQFCTCSDDKTVKIWSPIATNRFIASLSGVHTNWVRHSKYSRLNPHLIASCGDDGLVCVWDIRTKEAVIQLTSRRKSTHFVSLEWHPTCEAIISSSSADTSIRIWDLRKEKMIQYYAAHTGSVNATAFHSSGNYLISASSDETSKIFDLLEGRGLFTLKAHNGSVNCCAFTSDGQSFATAGNDKQILIWKSNLISDWDDSTGIVEMEDQMNEPIVVDQRRDVPQLQSTPKSAKYQTPVMNGNGTPLKSALRRTNFEEMKSSTDQENNIRINKRYVETSDKNRDTLDHMSTGRSTPSGDYYSSAKNHSITQSIINQMKALTDSVLQIEARLTSLEHKFDKHCSAQSTEESRNE